ncbi:MAG: response regulator [Pseudomonadota bacterium]|nr:response regulator [Pseudomonadota bacterium]
MASLLIWIGQLRLQTFKNNQIAIAAHSAHNVAEQIVQFIDEKKYWLKLFSQQQQPLLAQFMAQPLETHQRDLEQQIKLYFNQHLDFGVMNAKGQLIRATDEEMINNINELKSITPLKTTTVAFKGAKRHFYVLAPVEPQGFLLLALPLELLTPLLTQGQPYQQRLGLATPQHIQLPAAEKHSIVQPISLYETDDRLYELPIENTPWVLVSLATPSLFKHQRYLVWRQTATIFIAFMLLGIILAVLTTRAERQRQRSEWMLHRTENRLNELINHLPIILWAINRQGRITCSQGKALHSLGLQGNELVGKNIFEYYHDHTDFLTHIMQTLAVEARIVAPIHLGDQGHIFETLYAPLYNPAHRLNGALILAIDITEYQHRQQQLEQQLNHSQLMLDQTTEGILIIDLAGIVQEINAALSELTGYAAEELVGLPLKWVKALFDTSEFTAASEAVKQQGCFEVERQLQHKYGKTIEISVRHCWVATEALTPVIISFIRDISAYKQQQLKLQRAQQAAERANQAKGEFLATMSHEIRTPMNGVIGTTELLQQTPLDENQLRYVDMIRHSGETLLNLINDILDFSKIEAGKLTLESIDFDLAELLAAVMNLLSLSAYNKGLELIAQLPPRLTTQFHGDPARLRQIFNNLLSNAIKFTPQGEVILTVAQLEDTETSATLHFEIIDSGIGISPEAGERLFKPFSQVHQGHQYGGSGLGLVITRRLIQLMGGEIGLKSKPGQGSTFWFNIAFPKASPVPLYTPEQLASLAHLKLLIIEGQPQLRRYLTELAQTWQIYIHSVSTPQAALACLQQPRAEFNLVLLDTQDLTWIETFKTQCPEMPLVLLAPVAQSRPKAIMESVDSVLNKPILPQNWLTCLLGFTHPQAVETPSPAVLTTASVWNKHILLAEDDRINQEVITALLTHLGCQVTLAHDGEQVLHIYSSPQSYDLIFMDCHMPHLDGFAASRAIRQQERLQGWPPIPIIALTANAMQGDRAQCLAAGMDDYLTKPVNSETLQNILQRYLTVPTEA